MAPTVLHLFKKIFQNVSKSMSCQSTIAYYSNGGDFYFFLVIFETSVDRSLPFRLILLSVSLFLILSLLFRNSSFSVIINVITCLFLNVHNHELVLKV